jgi:hypothetical protein
LAGRDRLPASDEADEITAAMGAQLMECRLCPYFSLDSLCTTIGLVELDEKDVSSFRLCPLLLRRREL